MLMLRLWGCGHRPCDVHKSTGVRAKVSQINPANTMGAVVNVENAILGTGSQRHRLLAERLADANGAAPETDRTVAANLANNIARPILDRRQSLAERPRAGAIARRRRLEAERLMRTLMIIDRPPPVEGVLTRH